MVAKNPVMFVVEIGSILTTLLIVRDIAPGQTGNLLFTIQVTLWLWFTVLVCELCRSDGRRTRQGSGRHASQSQDRNDR